MAQPMPMPSERRAPKFEGDGRTLTQFLNDYKRLADAALLTEHQAIERIVIYLAAGPRKLVERYVEFRRPTTWDKFHDRFLEDYLDAQEPDEYRRADYDAFLVKSRADPPKSVEKLGEFTREFRSMAADVQRAGGLGDVEMRKHFCTVLETAIGDEFRTRMLVEYKGKTRSDWTIVDMLKQAKILLKEAEADADTYFPQKVGAATTPAAPSSAPTVKIEEQLNVLFGRLTSRIEQLERTYRPPAAAHVHVAQGGVPVAATVAPAGSALVHAPASAELSCYYCGGPHRMPDCSVLQEDLAKGRCLRNDQNRVVYPNGESIRGGFGGKMHDRVMEFIAAHPEYEKKGVSAATMLVELNDAYFAPLQDCATSPEFTTEDAAQAWASFMAGETFEYEEGEKRQYNLRARQPAPNVPAQKPRTKAPVTALDKSAVPGVRDPPPHLDPGRVDRMPPSTTVKDKSQPAGAADRQGSAAAQPPTPVRRSATIEEVPDDDAPPPRVLPQPVTLPSAMSAPRPQFQLRAPVESEGLAKVISERILQSQVALSVQELFAVSPYLRRHWHEKTAVKRVTIGYTGAEDAESDAGIFHFERINQPTASRDLIAAEVALPLRYLDCFVGDYKAEGVVDNGSQLVLISQKFWEALGCPLDVEQRINMTAANNSAALTKGLCANLEVRIGGISWYLQAHVVEDAPFSLLLGRPFLCVSSAREDNLPDGSTFLTLNDPNTGRAARIPTRARRNPRSAPFPAGPPTGF